MLVTKYMFITKFSCLTIEATHLEQNHWFTNRAFAVHDNTILHLSK